ncbi:hypothetical protein Y032_0016g2976 [Ancylostoma ceylanicum]|uniref:Uncharacterized protein n=1 Tax=Ancylostoma ceylanicum TaxID=53326 RepID=A0A016V575_9BILA|nr:hypothetical protein Y032_0016g2976 [Ancylostoma ceylanicum]
MTQANGYALIPVQAHFRQAVAQPIHTPIRTTLIAPMPAVARVPLQCAILPSPRPLLYTPVVHAPIPFQVQRPMVVAPTTSNVNSIVTNSSSAEYDSGVAFMDVSDPSLQVDVSLSLPSTPSSSNGSAPSPLPTDDFECGEVLNTAFDDRDFDSISPEGSMTPDKYNVHPA